MLQLWFQLLKVSLHMWHLVSSHFQLLHFAKTVQDSVSGLFHLPPHLCLLPLQARLQSSRLTRASWQLFSSFSSSWLNPMPSSICPSLELGMSSISFRTLWRHLVWECFCVNGLLLPMKQDPSSLWLPWLFCSATCTEQEHKAGRNWCVLIKTESGWIGLCWAF